MRPPALLAAPTLDETRVDAQLLYMPAASVVRHFVVLACSCLGFKQHGVVAIFWQRITRTEPESQCLGA
eukprot:6186565-Pleurochrysis_carterae.AAC.5